MSRLSLAERLGGLFAVLILVIGSSATQAQTERGDFWFEAARDGSPIVRLHYFHSPTCQHCLRAAPVLDEMENRLPWLKIERYSILNNRGNALLYNDLGRQLGARTGPTPGFVYCGKVDIGFDTAASTGRELERGLTECYEARLAGAPLELREVTITEFPETPRGAWLSFVLPVLGVGIAALIVLIVAHQRKARSAVEAEAERRATRKAKRKHDQAAALERRKQRKSP